jgi:hypothetical protein
MSAEQPLAPEGDLKTEAKQKRKAPKEPKEPKEAKQKRKAPKEPKEPKEARQLKKPKSEPKHKEDHDLSSPSGQWVRIQELNGWEREEWFRYYPLEESTKPVWTRFQERLKEYNAKVAHKLTVAIKDAVRKQRQEPRGFGAMFGFPPPMPSVARCDLTEFDVSIVSKTEVDQALAQETEESKEETGDMSEQDARDRKFVRDEWSAFRQGEAAYRVMFYRMGKSSSYTQKHKLETQAPSLDTLEALVNGTDDDIFEAMYKSQSL